MSRGVDRLAADLSAVSGAVTWNLVTNAFSGPVGFTFTNFEVLGVGDSDTGRFRTGGGNDILVTTNLDESDFIDAGGGDDSVTVSRGTDRVIGGTGNDVFRYDFASDSTASARDQILDFTLGDTFNLNNLASNNGRANFTFIGGGAQSGAGQVQVVQNGGSATVNVFIDADNVADLVLNLTVADSHTLTSADFSGAVNQGASGLTGFADAAAALGEPGFDAAVHGSPKSGFDALATDLSAPDHLLIGRFEDLRQLGATHDFVL